MDNRVEPGGEQDLSTIVRGTVAMRAERPSITLGPPESERPAAIEPRADESGSIGEESETPPDRVLLASRLLKRAAAASALAAWFSLGLGVGFLGAEAGAWARWGAPAGPHVMEVLRRAGWKLPCSRWVGVERVLEWTFTQSIFVCAGLLFVLTFVCGRELAIALTRARSHMMWRRLLAIEPSRAPEPPPESASAKVEDVARIAWRIEQAYASLDRRAQGEGGGARAP